MLSLFLPAYAAAFAFFELGQTELVMLLALMIGMHLIKRGFAASSWPTPQLQMTAICLLGCLVVLSGLAVGKVTSQQALSGCGIFAVVWLTWWALFARAAQ